VYCCYFCWWHRPPTFNGHNQTHLYIIKKCKIEYYDYSTTHDRSLYISMDVIHNNDNKQMHIFSSSSSPPFFFPSQSQGPLLPYTHTKQKDGDTLHLIFHPLFLYVYVSVCLIRKKKYIYI
jgi:hypothetical protein